MIYYAVIDTNVLVSAMLKWESVPGNVLELAFKGVIVPLVNEQILSEYREVLSRPKFHFTNDIIETVIGAIEKQGINIDAAELDIDLPDSDDKVFYEVVMEKRKSEKAYLITGNIRHFPTKPFVVTPRQMIDIIMASQKN